MDKKQMHDYIEKNRDIFIQTSDQLWDFAETAFEEFQSAAYLCNMLTELGFQVEKGIGGLETAFQGVYGQGKPVIGILGEFDALSNMSQKACSSQKEEIQQSGNGHGCGHNMLGAASLAAAAAVKEYLTQNNLPGTVIYYGCPAEEGGSGKAFMAKEGIFNALDAAFTWHPSYVNGVMDVGMLANYQVLYKFKGIASHAAASPHLGRSALDAVELMNVGANYLREHIISSARIHYAITNTGGFSPNVVQSEAEVLYLIRAPKNNQVEEIYHRVNKIAQGAALMTETDLTIQFVKSCSNIIPNKTLFEVMDNNLRQAPMPQYTASDKQFAAQMAKTLTKDSFDKTPLAPLPAEDIPLVSQQLQSQVLYENILPFHKEIQPKVLPASSDVGDVSWNVPTGQIVTACYAIGTPAHSWQLVSQGKHSVAHKGLLYAAKVMAGSAIDLLQNPSIIEKAKEELKIQLDGESYQCAIPEGTNPKALRTID